MITTVTGLYPTPKSAEHAVEALFAAGYDRQQISVVMKNTPHGEETVRAASGDVGGHVVAGALLGGALAALAATALALPVIGVIAAGPLLASLAGGGAGAVAGTGLGALLGKGTGGKVADGYLARIAQGEVLIGVDTDRAHAKAARDVLETTGASDISEQEHVTKPKHEPRHEVEAQA